MKQKSDMNKVGGGTDDEKTAPAQQAKETSVTEQKKNYKREYTRLQKEYQKKRVGKTHIITCYIKNINDAKSVLLDGQAEDSPKAAYAFVPAESLTAMFLKRTVPAGFAALCALRGQFVGVFMPGKSIPKINVAVTHLIPLCEMVSHHWAPVTVSSGWHLDLDLTVIAQISPTEEAVKNFGYKCGPQPLYEVWNALLSDEFRSLFRTKKLSELAELLQNQLELKEIQDIKKTLDTRLSDYGVEIKEVLIRSIWPLVWDNCGKLKDTQYMAKAYIEAVERARTKARDMLEAEVETECKEDDTPIAKYKNGSIVQVEDKVEPGPDWQKGRSSGDYGIVKFANKEPNGARAAERVFVLWHTGDKPTEKLVKYKMGAGKFRLQQFQKSEQ